MNLELSTSRLNEEQDIILKFYNENVLGIKPKSQVFDKNRIIIKVIVPSIIGLAKRKVHKNS